MRKKVFVNRIDQLPSVCKELQNLEFGVFVRNHEFEVARWNVTIRESDDRRET